jgi:hypothetical protein
MSTEGARRNAWRSSVSGSCWWIAALIDRRGQAELSVAVFPLAVQRCRAVLRIVAGPYVVALAPAFRAGRAGMLPGAGALFAEDAWNLHWVN